MQHKKEIHKGYYHLSTIKKGEKINQLRKRNITYLECSKRLKLAENNVQKAHMAYVHVAFEAKIASTLEQKILCLNHFKYTSLGEQIGMKPNVLSSRFADSDKFRLGEVKKLMATNEFKFMFNTCKI